jgi:hypothetical protein
MNDLAVKAPRNEDDLKMQEKRRRAEEIGSAIEYCDRSWYPSYTRAENARVIATWSAS